jgi:ribA/ribD-fused uncharacterized protein
MADTKVSTRRPQPKKEKQVSPSSTETEKKQPVKKPMNKGKREVTRPMKKRQEIRFYRQNDDYGCFSNFYPSPFTFQKFEYPTVEHFFQAMKMAKPEDINAVRIAKTPVEAKKIGRERTMRSDWETIKFDVMVEGLKAKFSQNNDLKAILLGTGNAFLIEDSPTDKIWGCGKDGTGKNLLGVALSQVRTYLKLDRESSLDFVQPTPPNEEEEEEENEDTD